MQNGSKTQNSRIGFVTTHTVGFSSFEVFEDQISNMRFLKSPTQVVAKYLNGCHTPCVSVRYLRTSFCDFHKVAPSCDLC